MVRYVRMKYTMASKVWQPRLPPPQQGRDVKDRVSVMQRTKKKDKGS